MVKELRVYFEGDSQLRRGFHQFLGEIFHAAKIKRCRFTLIATNGRPVQDFLRALKAHPDAWNILLLDSDAAIDDSFEDILLDKGLKRSHEDSVFWMVQIMETWYLADVAALGGYYGSGFQENCLQGNPEIERIRKDDVLSRLKRATKDTGRGEYHKTKHAVELLA